MFDAPLPMPTRDQIALLSLDDLVAHLKRARANAAIYADIRIELERELGARLPEAHFRCMRCRHSQFDAHEIRASDGALSSLLGVEPARYRALVCRRCKFVELYQGSASLGQQFLDLLT